MRIISGKAGRTPILVPKEITRPTTDRVREAIFSILQDRVIDARVLDLFAGSGALGLEALSRGAKFADFVELQSKAVQIIHKNLEKTRLEGGRVIKAEVLAYLKSAALAPIKYDLVFADPPYVKKSGDEDWIQGILGSPLADLMAEDGYLVLEMPSTQLLQMRGWKLLLERQYGISSIRILQVIR